MNPLVQSLLISGSIFVVVMATQLGRRSYNVRSLARPLLICAVFAFVYLKTAPTDSVDFLVYGIAVVIGAAFGYIAYRTTSLDRAADGSVWTICRTGFVAIWLAAVAVRIVFISLAEYNHSFRQGLGEFMFTHRIAEEAIAPFFVLMALSMVVVRIAFVAAKVRSLTSAEPTASAVPAAV